MGYNGPNWTQEGVGDAGIECGTKKKKKKKKKKKRTFFTKSASKVEFLSTGLFCRFKR